MTVAVIGAKTGTFVPYSSGMRVELDQKTLSVTLPQLLAPEITKAFARMLWKDLAAGRVVTNHPDQRVLSKRAIEVHGSAYPPLLALHWGLTPSMMGVFDGDLLPSFAYFRIYFEEDVCRVHVDRAACQFSMSLTLASSDSLPWALSIGTRPVAPDERVAEDFGDEPYRSYEMSAGDAVVYQGSLRRHGRVNPNPNRWSAHLFFEWVERSGPHACEALEKVDLRDLPI